MSEFLGARISLISKSDIRYVGILHEINSSDSTVSLENVRSFGTEGRKGDVSEEVAPSDQVYEYIVFRGSDVKDLRIEEGPGSVKENKPPAVPNDPAILGGANQDARPPPIGPGADKQKGPAEMPSEPKVLGHAPIQQASTSAPTPPVQSKPTVEEVKATAASLETNGKPGAQSSKSVPTGPRGTRITPAVPLPAALTAKVTQQALTSITKQAEGNPAASAAALRDATQAARAAVAVAMANLNGPGGAAPAGAQQNGNAMDNLTNKVNEMRVNAARSGAPSNRGRGRGGRQAKIDVPDADFDFASSNAKFNKDDLVKEAIAGSPAPETPNESASDVPEAPTGNPPQAYNKTRSFFDNISSEAKERADNNGQKPGGREWRGEEQRKNMETFGQGSVDGGFRGYRGRGRGRGGMRGRGYGQGRGRGGYRGPRTDAPQTTAQQ
ncbi:putative g2 m phase checkpoint control protein [Phaeoacremonium minimum UCRPA7]|uniref:Putative g2 m phase checkpoint control protein n=1 Tax=Phaeoacremonium minimum (strain UCR-PA7) TaxID=1286976 RepID=R8BWE0_PHAM7|nr:putative g2 m phase checkpoint control protein [Phaeoacremonium minimum UCRPA7]EOO03645.1 putative g2 m phase checkpoint control protein [Phaeoacremonium minimum UCRPA7]